jgi:D-ribose pyranase
MIRGRLLNSEIISVLAAMGHTDQLVIADAGLPIPAAVKRIDLALEKGLPSFDATLALIASNMVMEKVILAEEIKENNSEMLKKIKEILSDKKIEIEFVSHEYFKKLSSSSKAIVRTGECTPYANIILQSGVNFEGE